MNPESTKVPILQVVLPFRMKLRPVAHFFSLTFGWVCCCFAAAPTQEWVKKGGQLVRVAFGKEVILVKKVL